MEIKIGCVGKVVSGKDIGHYVKVLDDAPSTGGFIILISESVDLQVGYDFWVESKDMLKGFFDEAGWVVEWM